jgi:hypothetical protein
MKSSSKERRLQVAAVDAWLLRPAREIVRRTTVPVFGGTEIFLPLLGDPSRCEARERSESMELDFDPEQLSIELVDARIGARLKSQPA